MPARLVALLSVAVALLIAVVAAQRSCAQSIEGPVEQIAESPDETGFALETIVRGLSHPWGVAWLPGGDVLITERGGDVRRVRDGVLEAEPVLGSPDDVLAVGQGGLMDIVLHPAFATNRLVYFTYTSGMPKANRTTLARAEYDGERFTNLEALFENSMTKPGGQHFGSRLLWMPDGSLLMSIGDGGNPPVKVGDQFVRDLAQDTSKHFGKTLRLTEDGQPAGGNPFASDADATPEVWTYGHRNIQGMAIDPDTGAIWATEHGARGGDELNLLTPGTNYGWPRVTYSREYWGPRISDRSTAEFSVDPKAVWTPCIAPSGLAFYTGDKMPGWRGDLFAGGLMTQEVRRVKLDGNRIAGMTSIPIGERVRDVRQGPDGFLYVLTDQQDGKLIRIRPE